MVEDGATYRSYLLRLWRENVADAAWRASLESITQESEPRHFPDLESLVTFLLAELETNPVAPASSSQVDQDGK